MERVSSLCLLFPRLQKQGSDGRNARTYKRLIRSCESEPALSSIRPYDEGHSACFSGSVLPRRNKYFICSSFPFLKGWLRPLSELCPRFGWHPLRSVAKAWLRERELSKLRSLPPAPIPRCLLSDFLHRGICSPAGKPKQNATAGGTPAPRSRSSCLRSSALPAVQRFFRTEEL